VNRTLLSCCALLVLLVGFGEKSAAAPSPAGLEVEIVRVTTPLVSARSTLPLSRLTETFWLTCDPPGGTLPVGDAVCRAIRAHPQAMLAPRDPIPAVLSCPSQPKYPPPRPTITMSIAVTADGATTHLASPVCEFAPASVAWQIFRAAADSNESEVERLARGLHCVEDPIVSTFAALSSTSRYACLAGQWTAKNERLIRIATQAPTLAALKPARLFTREPGARACAIPARSAGERRTVAGVCEVSVHADTISFVADWSGFPLSGSACDESPSGWSQAYHWTAETGWFRRTMRARRTWDVVVRSGRVLSVTHYGELPPATRACPS
jgi:hypothetical protein